MKWTSLLRKRILRTLQRLLCNLLVAAEAALAVVAARLVERLELRLVAHRVAVKGLLQAHPGQAHLVRQQLALRLAVLLAAVKVAAVLLPRLVRLALLQQRAVNVAAQPRL